MLSAAVVRSLTRALAKASRTGAIQRCFSNTPRVLSVTPELQQALGREIDEEQKLSRDNLQGASAPTIPGFQIATNQAEVRLTKQFGSESILVVFNVNHSVDMEEDYDDQAVQQVEPVPVAMPPFSVEITKGDQRLCFQLEITPVEDQPDQYDFRVEEFYVAPAAKNGSEDVPAEIYASSGKYIDPSLHDLLFVRYLEERGLDANFCNDLVKYATFYEHSQYVALLDRIKKFVAK